MKTKLIAMDLDGTLLLPDKTLSARNRAALDAAAEKGILVVPATGRLYIGLPEFIRALPYVRYVIAINGAQLYDAVDDKVLHTADLDVETALAIYDLMETFPLAYDAYIDDKAYMDRRFIDTLEDYIPDDPHVLNMVLGLRIPVDDLRKMVRERGLPIQKLQCFCADVERLAQLRSIFAARFPKTAVSSSLKHNIEINSGDAVKANALLALCSHLGIDPAETLAFGDGLNDISMLRAAGTGVAMANASDEVRAAADMVTASNVEDGVAQYLEKYVL